MILAATGGELMGVQATTIFLAPSACTAAFGEYTIISHSFRHEQSRLVKKGAKARSLPSVTFLHGI